MTQNRSSREHATACLGRIRAAVGWGPSQGEWSAALAVFVPALQLHHPLDVGEACRRWAEDEPRWPALATLLQRVEEARQRREPHQLAGHTTARTSARPMVDGHPKPIIRDPQGMRRMIEHIRANPGQYVAAKTLVEMGELMLERAGYNEMEPA